MTAVGYASTTGDARKVDVSGDTMTGDLRLNDSTPDTDQSATSKAYVLAAVAGAGTGTPSGTVTAETSFGQASAAGAATSYSRGDHTHGTPTLPSASTSVAGVVQLDGTAADIAALGSQAAGSVGKAADAGHVHPTTGVVLTSGDQVVNGEKTFNTNIPVFPATDPAFDNQGARKAYVDKMRERTARVRITNDDLSGLPAAAAWAIVQTSAGTKLQCSIAASVGDRIRVCGNCMYIGSHFLDWVLLDSGGSIALYATSESSTPPGEGSPAMYPSRTYGSLNNPEMFIVEAGHIAAGQVTVALAHQGLGTGGGNVVYAHSTYPFRLRLENIGAEPS